MNITQLSFEDGERIVQNIKRFCTEHNLHLDDLTLAVGEDVQKKIRDFLSTEVSFKLKKPDYFALFALLIAKEKQATCWEEVMQYVEQCESVLHIEHVDYKCCCSHPIQNVYRITNIHTNLTLLVGSECVNKYGIESLKERLKEVQRMEAKKKKYRLCESCDAYVIKLDEPSWKKTCRACWKKDKPCTFVVPKLKDSCSQCNGTMWFNGKLCEGCFY